jgi:hypothetical protein
VACAFPVAICGCAGPAAPGPAGGDSGADDANAAASADAGRDATGTGDATDLADTGDSSDGGAATDGGGVRLPGDRWVRIQALGPNSTWNLPGYTPAQVVQLVAKLGPDFLDRLTNGPQNPSAVLDGNGLTAVDFLQQVVNAERPGGTFSSRVDLGSYDSDPAAWLQVTQALLNLSVLPRPYALSVDDWVLWLNKGHTPAQGEAIIQALHAQGWKLVQVTQCGVFDMNGYGDYTETCVDSTNNWGTHPGLVAKLAQYYPQIQLYMDFPTPMDQYCVLSAGQQQSIADNIAANQSAWGVTYVFPFLEQGSVGSGKVCYFDASKITLPDGGTLLDDQLTLMNVYNP